MGNQNITEFRSFRLGHDLFEHLDQSCKMVTFGDVILRKISINVGYFRGCHGIHVYFYVCFIPGG